MKQRFLASRLLGVFLSTFLLGGTLLLFNGVASAAGTLNISPSTGLNDGQSISVSGSGFAASSTGTLVECNSDSSQPTVMVAGNAVPVGCTNPLNTLVTTSSSGDLAATSFTVHTGTVGPAASGNDSSGASSATDAANYPCPPTAAQIAAGDSCIITFGDAGGDDVSQNITFASQSAPASTSTTPSSTSSSSSSSSTQPAASKSSTVAPTSTLANTGPGDTIGLFVLVAGLGSLSHYLYSKNRRAKATNL